VVELSKRLGMDTIAEGAESEEQGDRLREIGCRLLQGYACARPVPPRDAELLLARQHGMADRASAATPSHAFTPHSDIHPSLGA
jgi:EAL domain-containing protein (putative c-di-GMP-specific phosphodiesterase class I)